MFTVTSLFTLAVLLAGYAAAALMKCRSVRLEGIALAIGLGLLINHALIVTGLEIPYVLGTTVVLAIAGLAVFWRDIVAHGLRLPTGTTFIALACVTLLGAAYYFRILYDPLLRWDARSVWFFHAKMIWTREALDASTGFDHPSVAFTSPDYPNLVPAIAAQLAYMKGFWNEYLPKASLVVMLVPVLLWVFSFQQLRISFLFLVLLFFFSYDEWMWNGYMDAYLILYAGVALLNLGRYLAKRRRVDLFSSMCALGIMAMTKNEGQLFAASIALAVLIVAPLYSRSFFRTVLLSVRREPALVAGAALLLAPALMWSFATRAWGFQNALVGDASSGFARLAARMVDGSSVQTIFHYLFQRATAMGYLLTLVGATGAVCFWLRARVPAGAPVAIMTAAFYVSGLYAVYLSTPVDLMFHLDTSAGRTMATGSMSLLIAVYFLLTSIESLPAVSRETTVTAEVAENAERLS